MSTTDAATGATVHKSRLGYHACSYQDYLMLKKLHTAYWRAVRQAAAWRRWQRKAPRSRVVRERVRDANGRVVGRRVTGPAPEPPLCPVFAVMAPEWQYDPETAKCVQRHVARARDHGVIGAYFHARKPQPAPDQVVALVGPASLELYRSMAASLERA